MMGSHQLLCKSVMYEEAVKVPLLLRLPGQRTGRRIPQPVSQIDFVPTLLDYLVWEVPAGLHGRSLRPLLEQPQAEAARDVITECNGPSAIGKKATGAGEGEEWVRELGTFDEITKADSDPLRTIVTTDGWKFTWSPRGFTDELFNLNDDPQETCNHG